MDQPGLSKSLPLEDEMHSAESSAVSFKSVLPFADGVDNDVDFAGSGSANTAARSDHNHACLQVCGSNPSRVVAEVYGPCTVTSDTGTCSSGGGSYSRCCVCKP